MDVIKVANKTLSLVEKSYLIEDHPEYGKNHLRWMIEEITQDRIAGEKAHRWIGWIQGVVCIGGGATLEELKKINSEN